MEQRQIIIDKIDNIEEELIELSDKIHQNPELAFNEYNAVKNITNMLKSHGFIIEKGIGGLETALEQNITGKVKDLQ